MATSTGIDARASRIGSRGELVDVVLSGNLETLMDRTPVRGATGFASGARSLQSAVARVLAGTTRSGVDVVGLEAWHEARRQEDQVAIVLDITPRFP